MIRTGVRAHALILMAGSVARLDRGEAEKMVATLEQVWVRR